MFFRLKQGEFIAYADGKDLKVQFELFKIQRQFPETTKEYANTDLEANFKRIYGEARSLFKK